MDSEARTALVPSRGVKRATVSFEDIRLVQLSISFGGAVQTAIDEVDATIDDVVVT